MPILNFWEKKDFLLMSALFWIGSKSVSLNKILQNHQRVRRTKLLKSLYSIKDYKFGHLRFSILLENTFREGFYIVAKNRPDFQIFISDENMQPWPISCQMWLLQMTCSVGIRIKRYLIMFFSSYFPHSSRISSPQSDAHISLHIQWCQSCKN